MEPETTARCWQCRGEIDLTVKVGRYDNCPSCDADLRCCRNCRFWDRTYHNECRENVSTFIRDREKANFCGSFEIKRTTDEERSEADDARARLEALFQKRS